MKRNKINLSFPVLQALLAVFTLFSTVHAAELRPGFLFQDNMVLQRELSAPVWGWANPGDRVTVSFAGQELAAVADEDGYWIVPFKGLEASGEGRVLAITDGDARIEFQNVVVGDVWFSAGQSNMARSVGMDVKPLPLLAARMGKAEIPNLRYIRFGGEPGREPMKDRNDENTNWLPMTEETFLKSEAIPFFFGRHLHQTLDVPIGLVQVSVSGTTQTAWAPREVLDQMHGAGVSKSFAEWMGKTKPADEPKKNDPCVLHNSQIHPFAPFGMRGLIWHQGEGGPQEQHAERMVAIVEEWRRLFGHDFVYLWGGMSRNGSKSPPLVPVAQGKFYKLARNRQFLEAQQLFGHDSKSAFVDFYDLGNGTGHWAEKDTAGIRFANAALTLAHGQSRIYTGPRKLSEEFSPGKVTVRFTHTGEGLLYKPSIDGISGFVFHHGQETRWIEPRVEGADTLVFEDPAIGPDTGIFYAWHGNPHETLFNSAGIPASVFNVGKGSAPGREEDSPELLEIIKKGGARASLNVLHVRRHVVTCAILPRQIKETSTLRFRLPEEWSGVAVELDGKPVQTGPVRTDGQGRRSVEFEAEANRWSYMIFDPAKETEARAEVDLSRS